MQTCRGSCGLFEDKKLKVLRFLSSFSVVRYFPFSAGTSIFPYLFERREPVNIDSYLLIAMHFASHSPGMSASSSESPSQQPKEHDHVDKANVRGLTKHCGSWLNPAEKKNQALLTLPQSIDLHLESSQRVPTDSSEHKKRKFSQHNDRDAIAPRNTVSKTIPAADDPQENVLTKPSSLYAHMNESGAATALKSASGHIEGGER